MRSVKCTSIIYRVWGHNRFYELSDTNQIHPQGVSLLPSVSLPQVNRVLLNLDTTFSMLGLTWTCNVLTLRLLSTLSWKEARKQWILFRFTNILFWTRTPNRRLCKEKGVVPNSNRGENRGYQNTSGPRVYLCLSGGLCLPVRRQSGRNQ